MCCSYQRQEKENRWISLTERQVTHRTTSNFNTIYISLAGRHVPFVPFPPASYRTGPSDSHTCPSDSQSWHRVGAWVPGHGCMPAAGTDGKGTGTGSLQYSNRGARQANCSEAAQLRLRSRAGQSPHPNEINGLSCARGLLVNLYCEQSSGS